MTDNNGNTKTTAATPPTFTEAPASWNVRYVTADGFEAQLTLRGENGTQVLDRAAIALKHLVEQGGLPTGGKSNGNGATNPAAFCTIHNVTMKRHEKDGQIWYSHKVGEDYCRGAK